VIRIFLGYDARETVAFHVAAHSIHRHATRPVTVAPVMLSQLGGIFSRPRDPKQSTDFSFSRFLVPHLCDYQGWALFADCDILVRDDVARLWDQRDQRYAVQVVQHTHVPVETTKFLGHQQTAYAKKNWSSVILFNCAKCTALTPDYVNTSSGLDLHQFRWLSSDALIGPLPHGWNFLVDYDAPPEGLALSNLHYTKGGPWFEASRRCSFAPEWWQELGHTLQPIAEQGWPTLPVPREYLTPRKACA
jgi:hypothetical protein